MDEQLEIFFGMFRDAVNTVDKDYLYTLYYNVEFIKNSNRRIFQKKVLLKSAERTFCNELYHQLRNLIDDYRETYPGFLPSTILQAEVQKRQIGDLLNQFQLNPLSQNFIPDFILHTPGNADLHAYVIEVKSNRFLSNTEIAYDLNKIAEFIQRYRYQRGLFLAINLTIAEIQHLITQCNFTDETLQSSNSIFIVTRDRDEIECDYRSLNQLLNV